MRFKKKTTEGSVKTGLLMCVGVIGLLGLTTGTDLVLRQLHALRTVDQWCGEWRFTDGN